MAEKSPELLRFVLFAPYRKDAKELRKSVYLQHRQGIAELQKEGIVQLGGPLCDPIDHSLTASLVMLCAESFEVVDKLVKADIYYTSGVWDLEKLYLLELGGGVPSSI